MNPWACPWSGVPYCGVFPAVFLTLRSLISDTPRPGKWSNNCPPPKKTIMRDAGILTPVANAGDRCLCGPADTRTEEGGWGATEGGQSPLVLLPSLSAARRVVLRLVYSLASE